tara:strand:- start:762 stop:1190 length:429 start_codon:yes stop_codon:yes gene_type:complete
MKIERKRLLEIIKEEVDWARQARSSVQEALQADTITRLENLMMDLQDEGSSLVGVLEAIIDQIKKDEGLQEQEVSPWQKLAGIIQEAGSPQIPLPKDLVFELIEYLQDMSGLKLKGSNFIASRAKELLAKMDTGDTGPGAGT